MPSTRNTDIRIAIKQANLYLWEIAEEMSIHENTLYRMLRYNLSDVARERILCAIETLKNK